MASRRHIWLWITGVAAATAAVFAGFQAVHATTATFAVIVISAIAVGAASLSSRWASDSFDDRRFLFRIFLVGYFFRLAIALFQYFYLTPDFFAPDQNAYHLFASMGAERMEAGLAPFPETALRHRLYVIYCAYLYYLFGSDILLPSLLNSIYGCLAAMAAYRLTAMLDTPEAGRYTALLVLFTPSHMLWSALNLRDVPAILSLMFAVYFMTQLKLKFSFAAVLGFVLAMLVLLGLRDYIFFLTLGSLLIGYLGVRSGRMLEFMAGGILVMSASIFLYNAVPDGNPFARPATLADIQTYRQGFLSDASSAFLPDADVSTPAGALLYFPIGLAYFLLAPFPWQWGSPRQIIAVPETLLWYSLIPATIAGFVHIARTRLGTTLPLLILIASVTVSYAMVQGNIGTSFRHRAQVIVFLYVFSAIGLRLRRTPQPNPPVPGGHPATSAQAMARVQGVSPTAPPAQA